MVQLNVGRSKWHRIHCCRCSRWEFDRFWHLVRSFNIYQYLTVTSPRALRLTLTSPPSPRLSQAPELEKEILDSKVVHWRQCQVQKPVQLGGERMVGRTRALQESVTFGIRLPFFPKQLTRGGLQGVWHFACKFMSAENGSCELSMCISTAQARTKQCPRTCLRPFFPCISIQNGSCEMSVRMSPAQARTIVLPGLGAGLPHQLHPPQPHHFPPPPHEHHRLPLIIIIIIIIIIITKHYPLTPPTLFGASCRDNFGIF